MTLQRTKLGDIAYVAAVAGAICTNPVGTTTVIKGLVLHNTHTSAVAVQVHVVPDSGGALGVAAIGNRVLNVSLPANDTLLVDFPYAITLADQNDSLQAVAATASKVTVLVLGDRDI